MRLQSQPVTPRWTVRAISLMLCVLVLLSVSLGIPGCAKRGTGDGDLPPAGPPTGGGPVPVQATPERPRVKLAVVRLGESYEFGGRSLGEKDLAPGAETIIGLDNCFVHIELEPVPLKSWFEQHVKTSGQSVGAPLDYLYGHAIIGIPLADGAAGDEIAIALGSVTVPGSNSTSVTYVLKRSPEPRVAMEVWEDGARWREVAPSDVLQTRPLRLRLVSTKPLDQLAMTSAVDSALPGHGPLTWHDATTVSFEVADPPASIRISLDGVRDTEGLWAHGGLPVVFTGPPPRLYAFSPGDGEAPGVGLRLLPANILSAEVSSAGDRLFLSYAPETTNLGVWGDGIKLILPVSGGDGVVISRIGRPAGWIGNDAVALAGYHGLAGHEDLTAVSAADGSVMRQFDQPEWSLRHVAISPDGRHLAGVVYRYDDAGVSDYLTPTDLCIVSLLTGETRTIKDFVRTYLPPMEWIIYSGPVWSVDGRYIAGVSDVSHGLQSPGGAGTSTSEIRVVSLETGEVSTRARLEGVQVSSANHLSQSPDGKWWLLGNILASTESGGETRSLRDGLEWGRGMWSPDSRHVAFSQDWSMVVVVAVDGDGATSLGPGLGCGWDTSGRFVHIVWPDANYRYDPYQ